jgi:hypothetical protein
MVAKNTATTRQAPPDLFQTVSARASIFRRTSATWTSMRTVLKTRALSPSGIIVWSCRSIDRYCQRRPKWRRQTGRQSAHASAHFDRTTGPIWQKLADSLLQQGHHLCCSEIRADLTLASQPKTAETVSGLQSPDQSLPCLSRVIWGSDAPQQCWPYPNGVIRVDPIRG